MKNLFLILFSAIFLCACAHIDANERDESFRFKYYGAVYKDMAAAAVPEVLVEAGFALEKSESESFFIKGISADGKTEIEVFMTEKSEGALFEAAFYHKRKAVNKEKPYNGFFSDLDKKVFSY